MATTKFADFLLYLDDRVEKLKKGFTSFIAPFQKLKTPAGRADISKAFKAFILPFTKLTNPSGWADLNNAKIQNLNFFPSFSIILFVLLVSGSIIAANAYLPLLVGATKFLSVKWLPSLLTTYIAPFLLGSAGLIYLNACFTLSIQMARLGVREVRKGQKFHSPKPKDELDLYNLVHHCVREVNYVRRYGSPNLHKFPELKELDPTLGAPDPSFIEMRCPTILITTDHVNHKITLIEGFSGKRCGLLFTSGILDRLATKNDQPMLAAMIMLELFQLSERRSFKKIILSTLSEAINTLSIYGGNKVSEVLLAVQNAIKRGHTQNALIQVILSGRIINFIDAYYRKFNPGMWATPTMAQLEAERSEKKPLPYEGQSWFQKNIRKKIADWVDNNQPYSLLVPGERKQSFIEDIDDLLHNAIREFFIWWLEYTSDKPRSTNLNAFARKYGGFNGDYAQKDALRERDKVVNEYYHQKIYGPDSLDRSCTPDLTISPDAIAQIPLDELRHRGKDIYISKADIHQTVVKNGALTEAQGKKIEAHDQRLNQQQELTKTQGEKIVTNDQRLNHLEERFLSLEQAKQLQDKKHAAQTQGFYTLLQIQAQTIRSSTNSAGGSPRHLKRSSSTSDLMTSKDSGIIRDGAGLTGFSPASLESSSDEFPLKGVGTPRQ